jgi:drug/metabolite transporter (DMT)-like permease
LSRVARARLHDGLGRGNAFTIAAFFTAAVLNGANPVAIRFSNRELEPIWGACVRFGIAALILLGIAVALRLQLPRGRALVGAMLYGILAFGIAFSLGYYAFDHIHAGIGQTVMAIVPLLTLLLAVLHRQERFRPAAAIGGLLALAGIAVLIRAPLREGVPLVAFLAMLGCAVCVAEATVIVRWFPPVHAVTMNAIGMGVGASIQFVAAVFLGEPIVAPHRQETWVALAYSVVLGSIVAYILYVIVLARWQASRASYTFVVMPLVTVLVSVWLDNEPLRALSLVGGAAILVGVYVGALRNATATTESPAELRALSAPPSVGGISP